MNLSMEAHSSFKSEHRDSRQEKCLSCDTVDITDLVLYVDKEFSESIVDEGDDRKKVRGSIIFRAFC